MPELDEVMEFFKEWKTRTELEQKFSLGNTASFNLVNGLIKRGMIESWQVRECNKTNRVWYYRAKK